MWGREGRSGTAPYVWDGVQKQAMQQLHDTLPQGPLSQGATRAQPPITAPGVFMTCQMVQEDPRGQGNMHPGVHAGVMAHLQPLSTRCLLMVKAPAPMAHCRSTCGGQVHE